MGQFYNSSGTMTIHNVNATTKKAVEYLLRYLEEVTSDQNVICYNISVSDDKYRYGIGSRSDLSKLSTILSTAEDIQMDFCFNGDDGGGMKYGIEYFEDNFVFGFAANLDDDDFCDLAVNFSFKCQENSDWPPVITYQFQVNPDGLLEIGEPEYTEDLSIIDDIESWDDNHFTCTIEGDEELGSKEERKELLRKIHEFSKKFGTDEDIFEDSFFSLCNQAYLFQDQIIEFCEYLQYFHDFAVAHKADFTLEAEFTTDEEYACLKFEEVKGKRKKGKIVPMAIRF